MNVLNSLPATGSSSSTLRQVDRKLLHQLASAAHQSGKPCDLVSLWVATRMWGSGTSNGRGPLNTARGLTSKSLLPVLEGTASALWNGFTGANITNAYGLFVLPGSREAFFTKWFWALALDDPNPQLRPLILDLRVRQTVRKLLNGVQGWTPPRGRAGYIRYLQLMDAATQNLAASFSHLDSEKLEWLFYDRPPRSMRYHQGSTEPCLYDWL